MCMVAKVQDEHLTIDPRTKLILGLAGAALVLSACNLPSLALIGVGLAVLIALSGAGRAFGHWLKLVLPMTLFFGLVTTWAFGWPEGVRASLTLLLLTVVGFLFFVYTPPEDLANALVKSGVPFAAAFVVSAGMQFVPILGRKARSVLEAQKARGIPLNGGWQAFRRYPALMLPLLIQAFQLAEELAEAMECRGFGRPGRTYYKCFKLRRLDYAVMIAGGSATGVLIWGMRQWC
jgi:energy-coupling factor transport system permease protein